MGKLWSPHGQCILCVDPALISSRNIGMFWTFFQEVFCELIICGPGLRTATKNTPSASLSYNDLDEVKLKDLQLHVVLADNVKFAVRFSDARDKTRVSLSLGFGQTQVCGSQCCLCTTRHSGGESWYTVLVLESQVWEPWLPVNRLLSDQTLIRVWRVRRNDKHCSCNSSC